MQFLALFALLAVFTIDRAANAIQRRRNTPLRRIAAYEGLPALLGSSIEANRPLHFSLGSAAPGEDTTLLSLMGTEFIYYATQQITVSDAPPLISVSETSAIPLGINTLRLAYQSRQHLERFKPTNVRWYPAGERSLAFAAGITTLQNEENIGAHFLVGSFGAEIALLADTAYRYQRPFIAVSNRLEGQAVAYALSDETLIGEELFAAGGYLSNDPSRYRRTLTYDYLRWMAVALLVVLLIATLIARSQGGA
jgi:hypothetical protein